MTWFSFVSSLGERVGGREGFLQGGAAEMVLQVWSSSVTRENARNVCECAVQWMVIQTFQIH